MLVVVDVLLSHEMVERQPLGHTRGAGFDGGGNGQIPRRCMSTENWFQVK